MASQTRATPGVYARDRSSRLASETVGLIDIFPRLCRSKTGSAARAGSSSKLKKDMVTPTASDLVMGTGRPRSRVGDERRCDAGITRDGPLRARVCAGVTGD